MYTKIQKYLKRKQAVSRALAITFTKVNQIVRGWINYFKSGSIKTFLDEFGQWLCHKIKCIIIKQWKKLKIIYRNLKVLNIKYKCKCKFNEEEIYKCANTRLGWYRRNGMDIINFYTITESSKHRKRGQTRISPSTRILS